MKKKMVRKCGGCVKPLLSVLLSHQISFVSVLFPNEVAKRHRHTPLDPKQDLFLFVVGYEGDKVNSEVSGVFCFLFFVFCYVTHLLHQSQINMVLLSQEIPIEKVRRENEIIGGENSNTCGYWE